MEQTPSDLDPIYIGMLILSIFTVRDDLFRSTAMSTPLNIAVIGTGGMGRHTARALANDPDWALVAMCDVEQVLAQRKKRRQRAAVPN